MPFVMFALVIGFGAVLLAREAATGDARLKAVGFDGTGVIMAFAFCAFLAAVTTPAHAMAFATSVLLYEIASAWACRLVGHDIVRIRLIPLPFLTRQSDTRHARFVEEAFVALLPPAIATIPLVMCFGAAELLAARYGEMADMARIMGLVIGGFNFVMLLPFLPFAGGRVIRALSLSFAPQLSTLLSIFMTAAFASAALKDNSIAMMVLAGAGLQSLFHVRAPKRAQLDRNQALPVLAAYAFCLSAHYLGARWLLAALG